jgi:peptide/nickel transport system substrate-binding protein
LVLDSLGKQSSNVPFMMPKAVAATDPFKQIDSQVGSGPFIYQKDQSKPGERHVYLKNPKYKPRPEPASGLAGGKVAKVDRVEFVDMPDPTQQVNALIAGEIDMIENVPHDLLPLLKADKNVQTVNWNPLGQQFIIRFNHLTKPFDNPRSARPRCSRCGRRTTSRRRWAPRSSTRSAPPPSPAARPTARRSRAIC